MKGKHISFVSAMQDKRKKILCVILAIALVGLMIPHGVLAQVRAFADSDENQVNTEEVNNVDNGSEPADQADQSGKSVDPSGDQSVDPSGDKEPILGPGGEPDKSKKDPEPEKKQPAVLGTISVGEPGEPDIPLTLDQIGQISAGDVDAKIPAQKATVQVKDVTTGNKVKYDYKEVKFNQSGEIIDGEWVHETPTTSSIAPHDYQYANTLITGLAWYKLTASGKILMVYPTCHGTFVVNKFELWEADAYKPAGWSLDYTDSETGEKITGEEVTYVGKNLLGKSNLNFWGLFEEIKTEAIVQLDLAGDKLPEDVEMRTLLPLGWSWADRNKMIVEKSFKVGVTWAEVIAEWDTDLVLFSINHEPHMAGYALAWSAVPTDQFWAGRTTVKAAWTPMPANQITVYTAPGDFGNFDYHDDIWTYDPNNQMATSIQFKYDSMSPKNLLADLAEHNAPFQTDHVFTGFVDDDGDSEMPEWNTDDLNVHATYDKGQSTSTIVFKVDSDEHGTINGSTDPIFIEVPYDSVYHHPGILFWEDKESYTIADRLILPQWEQHFHAEPNIGYEVSSWTVKSRDESQEFPQEGTIPIGTDMVFTCHFTEVGKYDVKFNLEPNQIQCFGQNVPEGWDQEGSTRVYIKQYNRDEGLTVEDIESEWEEFVQTATWMKGVTPYNWLSWRNDLNLSYDQEIKSDITFTPNFFEDSSNQTMSVVNEQGAGLINTSFSWKLSDRSPLLPWVDTHTFMDVSEKYEWADPYMNLYPLDHSGSRISGYRVVNGVLEYFYNHNIGGTAGDVRYHGYVSPENVIGSVTWKLNGDTIKESEELTPFPTEDDIEFSFAVEKLIILQARVVNSMTHMPVSFADVKYSLTYGTGEYYGGTDLLGGLTVGIPYAAAGDRAKAGTLKIEAPWFSAKEIKLEGTDLKFETTPDGRDVIDLGIIAINPYTDISGQVVTTSNQPIWFATATLFDKDGKPIKDPETGETYRTHTDIFGYYSFADVALPDGTELKDVTANIVSKANWYVDEKGEKIPLGEKAVAYDEEAMSFETCVLVRHINGSVKALDSQAALHKGFYVDGYYKTENGQEFNFDPAKLYTSIDNIPFFEDMDYQVYADEDTDTFDLQLRYQNTLIDPTDYIHVDITPVGQDKCDPFAWYDLNYQCLGESDWHSVEFSRFEVLFKNNFEIRYEKYISGKIQPPTGADKERHGGLAWAEFINDPYQEMAVDWDLTLDPEESLDLDLWSGSRCAVSAIDNNLYVWFVDTGIYPFWEGQDNSTKLNDMLDDLVYIDSYVIHGIPQIFSGAQLTGWKINGKKVDEWDVIDLTTDNFTIEPMYGAYGDLSFGGFVMDVAGAQIWGADATLVCDLPNQEEPEVLDATTTNLAGWYQFDGISVPTDAKNIRVIIDDEDYDAEAIVNHYEEGLLINRFDDCYLERHLHVFASPYDEQEDIHAEFIVSGHEKVFEDGQWVDKKIDNIHYIGENLPEIELYEHTTFYVDPDTHLNLSYHPESTEHCYDFHIESVAEEGSDYAPFGWYDMNDEWIVKTGFPEEEYQEVKFTRLFPYEDEYLGIWYTESATGSFSADKAEGYHGDTYINQTIPVTPDDSYDVAAGDHFDFYEGGEFSVNEDGDLVLEYEDTVYSTNNTVKKADFKAQDDDTYYELEVFKVTPKEGCKFTGKWNVGGVELAYGEKTYVVEQGENFSIIPVMEGTPVPPGPTPGPTPTPTPTPTPSPDQPEYINAHGNGSADGSAQTGDDLAVALAIVSVIAIAGASVLVARRRLGNK